MSIWFWPCNHAYNSQTHSLYTLLWSNVSFLDFHMLQVYQSPLLPMTKSCLSNGFCYLMSWTILKCTTRNTFEWRLMARQHSNSLSIHNWTNMNGWCVCKSILASLRRWRMLKFNHHKWRSDVRNNWKIHWLRNERNGEWSERRPPIDFLENSLIHFE